MKIDVKKLKPMAGYVLVEPTEKDAVTKSGILLPTDTNDKPQTGKILAIGESKCNCEHCECQNCECGELEAKVGDTVVYKKWGGNDVKIDDIEYQFLKFEDILAKLEK
ncbi:co-chaperone GroES [bacterium]|nr:co-chaperone GroES [bacterium]